MNESSWQRDWRPAEPAPDFARRVLAELERGERSGARAPVARRAFGTRRGSSLVFLGLAAIALSGAALGALGPTLRTDLRETAQESSPTTKQRSEAVPVYASTPPAPIEPEPQRKGPESPPARRSSRPAPVEPALVETAAERPPVPIHIPPCECSTGAIVCSCVD